MDLVQAFESWKALMKAGENLPWWQEFYVKFYQAFVEADRWRDYLEGVSVTLIATALALLNDQVDCVVIDQGPAQEFVAQNAGLTILDTEYSVEDYAIGVAKGNEGLLNAINTALAELKADGTLQAIVDKYITAE